MSRQVDWGAGVKILVPVEDQQFGDLIIDFINKSLWAPETFFRLMHVRNPTHLDQSAQIAYTEMLDKVASSESDKARSLVSSFAQKIKSVHPKVEVLEDVVVGFPKDEIVKCAETWPAELVIMGSHGRNAIQRLFLGSVSLSVLGTGVCPVLIIPPPHLKGAAKTEKP
jgi:nucleotide-binding universal stress UspA family protein